MGRLGRYAQQLAAKLEKEQAAGVPKRRKLMELEDLEVEAGAADLFVHSQREPDARTCLWSQKWRNRKRKAFKTEELVER